MVPGGQVPMAVATRAQVWVGVVLVLSEVLLVAVEQMFVGSVVAVQGRR